MLHQLLTKLKIRSTTNFILLFSQAVYVYLFSSLLCM